MKCAYAIEAGTECKRCFFSSSCAVLAEVERLRKLCLKVAQAGLGSGWYSFWNELFEECAKAGRGEE